MLRTYGTSGQADSVSLNWQKPSLQGCKYIPERGVVLGLMPMATCSWTGLEHVELIIFFHLSITSFLLHSSTSIDPSMLWTIRSTWGRQTPHRSLRCQIWKDKSQGNSQRGLPQSPQCNWKGQVAEAPTRIRGAVWQNTGWRSWGKWATFIKINPISRFNQI